MGVEGFSSTMVKVVERLGPSSPYRSLVHGDPCPDNVFIDGVTAVFVDFDFASLGSCLRDGAYLHMPFATCWCVNQVPEGTRRRAIAVYRAGLTSAFPALADDGEYARAVADACAWWAVAMNPVRSLGSAMEGARSSSAAGPLAVSAA